MKQAQERLMIRGQNGGALEYYEQLPAGLGDGGIVWNVKNGYLFGVADNTQELRDFLKTVLELLSERASR